MTERLSSIQYARTVQLKNGMPVRIRPIRHEDRDRIIRAFHQLEPESIYTRFFWPKRELSSSDLARIDASDFVNALILVAMIGEAHDESIIGAGSYTVIDRPGHPRTAEISFTIEEDYHGQGLASMLMAILTEIARERGIQSFEAEVLASNSPMLRVFRHIGLPMRETQKDGVVSVVIDISGQCQDMPPVSPHCRFGSAVKCTTRFGALLCVPNEQRSGLHRPPASRSYETRVSGQSRRTLSMRSR